MPEEELQSVKLEGGLLKNEVEVRGRQIDTLLHKLDQTADKPFLRNLALRLPEFLQPQPEPYAFALGIDGEGNILYNLQYGANDAYSPITSVKQYGDELYFGSLTHKGWGKIKAPE